MNENNVPAGTLPDPCPFCGGACAATKGHSLAELPWSHDGGDFHRVYCSQCQSRQLFHRTEADAVAAWNRRAAAPVAQPPATAEAVKRMASIFAQQNGWDGADGAPEWLVELVQDVANALATQPPAPVQQTEAVACQMCSGHGLLGSAARFEDGGVECPDYKGTGAATPPAPATALPPVARVPLTKERILALWGDRSDGPPTHQIISFARAVEASTGEQSHG